MDINLYMLVLGIETTSKKGSVAVLKNGNLVSEQILEHQLKHSSFIIPAIDNILTRSGYHFEDINRLAVGIGPGSFTGIRVGIAVAKGLLLNNNIQAVGISSLQNIAYSVKTDKPVYSLIYAQRNEYFVQKFRYINSDEIIKDSDCHIIKLENLNDYIEKNSIVCGTDTDRLKSSDFDFNFEIFSDPLYPSAQNAAFLAWNIEEHDLAEHNINPFYVRRSEAEEKGAKVYKF